MHELPELRIQLAILPELRRTHRLQAAVRPEELHGLDGVAVTVTREAVADHGAGRRHLFGEVTHRFDLHFLRHAEVERPEESVEQVTPDIAQGAAAVVPKAPPLLRMQCRAVGSLRGNRALPD